MRILEKYDKTKKSKFYVHECLSPHRLISNFIASYQSAGILFTLIIFNLYLHAVIKIL